MKVLYRKQRTLSRNIDIPIEKESQWEPMTHAGNYVYIILQYKKKIYI